ncbi:PKD domain-containing protein [Parafilimonas sp.]|uniref:PKD domain-containing protein n=1 Tax=Parafilimonas sp. TaxID=1969739 RepID=UPI0039E39611
MKKFFCALFFGALLSCTLKAQLCTGSLGSAVVNIDFGSGSGRGAALGSSFTSYSYSSSGFPNDGYYTIANSTSGLLSSWWSTYDHDYQTTGATTGYMMVVNASLSVTDYFFKDTVTGLCAGTTYEFAAWILNLFSNGNTVYPNLTFNIYDASSGDVLGTYNTGNITGSTTAVDWEQYGFYFTATTNSVVLKITNNKAGAAPGNDLALDDITFKPCGGTITSSVSDGTVSKEICLGAANSVELVSSYSAATSNTQYQWQVSTDGGTTWSDISGATSSTYTVDDITEEGTYLYRLATAEGTNINSSSCRVLSNTITLIVDAYSAATLLSSYINCDDYTFDFENEDSSSDVAGYLWSFGDGQTSSSASPSHTYADTGTYSLTLITTNTNGCSDTASSTVKVYPGFTAAFSATGNCYLSPFQFTDKSSAVYGTINSWSWDFGDAATTADTSSEQNPSYTFSATGSYTVSLSVTSSKGCSGTATETVTAYDKPSLYLPFTDTLICVNDTLPLLVQTSADSITWSPDYYMIDSTIHTATAIVYPPDTTVYTVVVEENGCIDSATVQVNTLPLITVSFSGDTAICKTDTITLYPQSEALSYAWLESPSNNSLSNYYIKNPLASPDTTTTYYVTASLGHCQDSASVTVYVSAYPTVTVSADTSICYGTTAQLYGSTDAEYFSWSPTSSLINSNTLTPIAGPMDTTTYYLTVHGTPYCPKYVSDSVTVNVVPKLIINAGNDTTVVISQPLQFNVTGGDTASDSYVWSPTTELSNSLIYNPVAIYTATDPDSISYTVKVTTAEGCTGSDEITVRIMKIAPDILVPSGFTPNSDNLNDLLKALPFGIKEFKFFNVYNRYGQLIFTTKQASKGWDGTLNGTPQGSGTYVYMTKGIDYLGNVIFRKGTVVLIR